MELNLEHTILSLILISNRYAQGKISWESKSVLLLKICFCLSFFLCFSHYWNWSSITINHTCCSIILISYNPKTLQIKLLGRTSHSLAKSGITRNNAAASSFSKLFNRNLTTTKKNIQIKQYSFFQKLKYCLGLLGKMCDCFFFYFVKILRQSWY